MEPQPWRCGCGRLNKKTARQCGTCQWGYAPPPGQWEWDQAAWASHWEGNQWVQSPRRQQSQAAQWPASTRYRSESPRQRTYQESPRPRGRRKPKKNKNSAKQKEELEEPPWKWEAPSLPSLPAAATASSSLVNPKEEQTAAAKYKELLNQLKKAPDKLTPEIQAIVTKETVQETRGAAKSLHSAVSKMEKAQEALNAANGARLQLHSRWRTFIASAIPRWKTWIEDFQRDDADLQEKIKTAKEYLEGVQEEYGQQHTQFGLKGPIEIADDEDNTVDEAAGKIKESMDSMMQSLDDVKVKADMLYAEQEKAVKRPRIDQPDGTGSASEQPPFGTPGRTGP